VKFEWDPQKAALNLRKHGVRFQEEATIFADPLSVTSYDPDHSATESRFITIGMSDPARLLIVAHTDRGEGTRIISARQTTRRERKQ
jgi:uncharacterized DUF497 family protein